MNSSLTNFALFRAKCFVWYCSTMIIPNKISSLAIFIFVLHSSVIESSAKSVRENGSNCAGIKSCRPRCITFRLDRSIHNCSSSEGIFTVDSRLNPWETNRFRVLNCEAAGTCINDKCGQDLSGNLTVRIGEEGYSGSYFYTDVNLPEDEELFTFCSMYPCPKEECAVPEQMGFEIQLSILRDSQQLRDISESLLVLEFYLKNSFVGPPLQRGVNNRFGPVHVEWMDDPTGCREDFFSQYAPVAPPDDPEIETDFIDLGAIHYCSGEAYEARSLPVTAPPTSLPTNYPTGSPVATDEPTSLPKTESPTVKLTSLSPSSKATTFNPTSLPNTSFPTSAPTISPPVTLESTFAPSWSIGSALPSNEPSVLESELPSLLPTTSTQPSTFDSGAPSSVPSAVPTIKVSATLPTTLPPSNPPTSSTALPAILPSQLPTNSIETRYIVKRAKIFLQFPYVLSKMTGQADVTNFEMTTLRYINANLDADTLIHNVKILSQSVQKDIGDNIHFATLHQERRLKSGLQVEIEVMGETTADSLGEVVIESLKDYELFRKSLSETVNYFALPSNTDLSRNGDPSREGNTSDKEADGGMDWGLLAASIILSLAAAALVIFIRRIRRENRTNFEAKVRAISFPSEKNRVLGSVSDESDSGWNSSGDCSDEEDGNFVGDPVPNESTDYMPDESVAPWTILGVDNTVYDDVDAEECKNEETAYNNTPGGALC